jgi:hypothetical protein
VALGYHFGLTEKPMVIVLLFIRQFLLFFFLLEALSPRCCQSTAELWPQGCELRWLAVLSWHQGDGCQNDLFPLSTC